MKIRLLKDGGYSGMDNVYFPVEVYAVKSDHHGFDVPTSELIRIGADNESFLPNQYFYFTATFGECEVIE